MKGNYFVKSTDTFSICLPFDTSHVNNPQLVFTQHADQYPKELQKIAEENLEFVTFTFRRPGWGLDCYIREISYQTTGQVGFGVTQERVLSREKLNEARIRYLLTSSDLFENIKVSFVNQNGYEALSDNAENLLKGLDPTIMEVALSLVSQVLDRGVPPSFLFSKEDYLRLRNESDSLQKIRSEKGLEPKAVSLVNDASPEEKKKSSTSPSAPTSAASSPATTPGSP